MPEQPAASRLRKLADAKVGHTFVLLSRQDVYAAAAEIDRLAARCAAVSDSAARIRELEDVLRDICDAAAARIRELEDVLRDICDAAEALTRPGSQGREHVNVARMTNAVEAGAKLIGHRGIFPELTQ